MSAYMIYIRDEITDQKEMDIYNEESKKAPHEYEAEPLAFYDSEDEPVIIHFIVFHKMIGITEALYIEDIANIYEDKDYLI